MSNTISRQITGRNGRSTGKPEPFAPLKPSPPLTGTNAGFTRTKGGPKQSRRGTSSQGLGNRPQGGLDETA